MSSKNKNRDDQKGNALFLILIAVALFGALSYAITSSGRGGGGIRKEKVLLQVSSIESFAAQIQMALNRLKVIDGIQEWQVSYDAQYSYDAANVTGCTSTGLAPACKLFDLQGAGVLGAKIPFDPDNPASGNFIYNFRNVTVKGLGTDTQRDLMLQFIGVTRDVCMSFNDHVHVANPGGEPPVESHGNSVADYNGNITAQVPLTDAIRYGSNGNIDGKSQFCISDSVCPPSSPCYDLLIALIIR